GAEPLDLGRLRAFFLSDEQIRNKIQTVVARKQEGHLEFVTGAVKIGMQLMPLVGTIDKYLDGEYVEAGISLLGDVTMFLGYGAVLKARQCVKAAQLSVKIAATTDLMVNAGVGAFRLGQGIDAYLDGDKTKAYGAFGDATLRLLGVSARAITWLRTKPKCFVAGTPVHAEAGPKPIEQITVGERAWALDPQRQERGLCVAL